MELLLLLLVVVEQERAPAWIPIRQMDHRCLIESRSFAVAMVAGVAFLQTAAAAFPAET